VSVTRGQCDTRPKITFPTADYWHCTLAGTHFHPAEDSGLSWPEWLVEDEDGNPAVLPGST